MHCTVLFFSSLYFNFNPSLYPRDTIHIEGVKLGFDRPVFFDRHAVGGEYGAGWKSVGAGRLVTTFFGDVSIMCVLLCPLWAIEGEERRGDRMLFNGGH